MNMKALSERNKKAMDDNMSELVGMFFEKYFTLGIYSDFVTNEILAQKFAEFRGLPSFGHIRWLKTSLLERYPGIIIARSNGARGIRGCRLK